MHLCIFYVYNACFFFVTIQAMVDTGERIAEVHCLAPTFTVSWHPNKYLLAFACDDKVIIFIIFFISLFVCISPKKFASPYTVHVYIFD